MPRDLDSAADLERIAETLRRIEERLAALEQWRESLTVRPEQPAVAAAEAAGEAPDIHFDLSLIGRTLIVLGGAYLLRAVTEGGMVPTAGGVGLGLLYAASWSLLALRSAVTRRSAAYHGIATAIISLPLVFEATRKFQVLDAWSAALALLAVSAVVFALVARRRLGGVAWAFTLMVLVVSPLLMMETKTIVPFALYLTALGAATLWLGYAYEWRLLRWVVAAEVDVILLALSFMVATERLPDVAPVVAIAVGCIAFAAYVTSFAVRTLLRQREVVSFEIAQTLALLVVAVGGAMWVAASRGTLEVPLAVLMLVLGAASYAVSFAFIPRRFARPANFVCYSSLALMLIVAGGALITSGLLNAILWVLLALASGLLAVHYRKSSLALHTAVFLFSGFAGAGVISLGFRSLVLKVERGWASPAEGAILLLVACVAAAAIRPIERQGGFELWTAAKVMILGELGWIAATLMVSAIGPAILHGAAPDPALVAVVRTAVISGLTILTAWATRFPTLSPGRHLCNALMGALVMKLLWEDFRVGRPATLVVSLALVGAALILTPALRRRASAPLPGAPAPA